MLEYKLQWHDGRLIRVPAPYTSQTCSVCGHREADNRYTQARFRCLKCRFEINADVNGSLNIKRAGIAQIAREVNGASRQQREPAEVIGL